MIEPSDLIELIGNDLTGVIESTYSQMGWAEEEIDREQQLRPNDADVLCHSFGLLVPTHELMSTEFVYRSHVRELLIRSVRGEDTRLATWAELVCAMHDVSLAVPLHGAAYGLYARAWNRAFPEKPFPDQSDVIEHTEALYGSQIDDLEREVRSNLTDKLRALYPECSGTHHGEPATGCRYYRPTEEAALWTKSVFTRSSQYGIPSRVRARIASITMNCTWALALSFRKSGSCSPKRRYCKMRHEVIFNIRHDGPAYRATFKTDEDAKRFVDAIASMDGWPSQDKTLRLGPGQEGY